jgi:hypothetical protein
MTPRERFEALPQATKDKILDEHRDWNVEHIDWWDSVYEGFKEDMLKVGIWVEDMYFSGFSSQGDGACFEGRVQDWALFLPSAGYTSAALIDHASMHFYFKVEHSGHYYHENCTSFSSDMMLPEGQEDEEFLERCSPHEEDSLLEAVWMIELNKFNENTLHEEFEEVFKNHMRDLYKQLEAEHDYLTSDEAVLDSLEANDQLEDAIIQFTEECEDA